jgi:diguanylate cyclase (GGDEF)-like protein
VQLGRFRGDEFVLLLPGADQDKARGFADALREEVHKITLTFGDKRLKMRASIGISLFPIHGSDLDTLRYHAALANGLAKAHGGGTVAAFGEYLALDEDSKLRLKAMRSARRARRRPG